MDRQLMSTARADVVTRGPPSPLVRSPTGAIRQLRPLSVSTSHVQSEADPVWTPPSRVTPRVPKRPLTYGKGLRLGSIGKT
eukprot:5933250-Pleurochrysis_carterae.AAC.1